MSQLYNKYTSLTKTELITLLNEKDERINQLLSESALLESVLSLLPANVYWKKKNGQFLGCNIYCSNALQFSSRDEIIGKTLTDLCRPDVAKLATHNDDIVYETGKELEIEEIGVKENNEPATYLTKRAPLFDQNGEIIGLLGLSFDISDRKIMEDNLKLTKEKAESANRAKSKFLGMVTHELRTPLSSIIGLTNFLHQKDLPPDEKQKVIDAIENCASHLLNLVNDMLDFSQLDANKYNPIIQSLNLQTVINDVLEIVHSLAANKGITVEVKIDNDAPTNIYTDERVIRQILINLIGNAIKFSERGPITVNVRKLQENQHKTTLKIAVTDKGRGIPPDKLNIIFEPFQQLEDTFTRTSSRSGTGLGLTIVNMLSSIIGASIGVTSELGKGSCFSLTADFVTHGDHLESLPLAKRNHETDPSHLFINTDRRDPKVLLVEDDAIVQYIHKKMLSDLNCRVEVASKGQEAISLFGNHDLVFVDISLPDIHGFDLIKAIRYLDKRNRATIIALTAYTGKEEEAACLAAGANEFVSKPVSEANLKGLLGRYFKK